MCRIEDATAEMEEMAESGLLRFVDLKPCQAGFEALNKERSYPLAV